MGLSPLIEYFIFSDLELSKDIFFLCSSGLSKPLVGVAHHVSFMRPYGLFDVAAVTLANSLTIFPYVDSISNQLDFIGINYYGQVFYLPNQDYSRYHSCTSMVIINLHILKKTFISLVRKLSLVLDWSW